MKQTNITHLFEVEDPLDRANIIRRNKYENYCEQLRVLVKEYEVDGEATIDNLDFVEELLDLQDSYGFQDDEMWLIWDIAENGKQDDYGDIQGVGIAVLDGGERFILDQ